MDAEASSKLSGTTLKRLALRSTSSANDLQDAKMIQETDLTCYPQDHTTKKEKKLFRLPRIVLENRRKPDYTPLPSCLGGVLHPSPARIRSRSQSETFLQHCSTSSFETLADYVDMISETGGGGTRLDHTHNDVHIPFRPEANPGESPQHTRDQIRSSNAVTNSNMTGSNPSSQDIIPKDTPPLLFKPSEISMRPMPKNPSLLSSGSRTSARHSLLKPSITHPYPLDTGLPIPPILTDVAGKATEEVRDPRSGTSLRSLAAIAADDLILKDKALHLPRTTQVNIQETVQFDPSDIQTNGVEVGRATNPDLVSMVPKFHERAFVNETLITPVATPRAESPNAIYWGFVPSVKEAVNDAVQVAVRKAVHEVVVPPGIQKDQASIAYRRLVSSSLAQAALIADDYLRRPSLWDQPLENESPSNLDPPSIPAMETIKLESADKGVGENYNQGWSRVNPWNKELSRFYTMIGDSSQKEVLKSKVGGVNSAATASLRPIGSRNHSGSFSSVGSLKSLPSVAVEHATQHSATSENGSSPAAKTPLGSNVVSRNTARWVRGLLPQKVPNEARLTGLPPGSRRDRPSVTSAKPVTDLSLDAIAKPAGPGVGLPRTQSRTDLENKQMAVAETFTKTINDLEHLLNEALFIARQAADDEDAPYVPELLENATAILKYGRQGLRDDDAEWRENRARIVSVAYSSRHPASSRTSSIGSIHESLESCSESSGSESSDTNVGNNGPNHLSIPRIRLDTPSDDIRISTNNTRNRTSTWANVQRTTPYPLENPAQLTSHATEKDENCHASKDVSSARASSGKSVGYHQRSNTNSPPSDPGCILHHAAQDYREARSVSLPLPSATSHRSSIKVIRDNHRLFEGGSLKRALPSKRKVHEHITTFCHPPIQPRTSSLMLADQAREMKAKPGLTTTSHALTSPQGHVEENIELAYIDQSPLVVSQHSLSFDGMSLPSETVDFEAGYGHKQTAQLGEIAEGSKRGVELKDNPPSNSPEKAGTRRHVRPRASLFNLNGKHHVSIRGEHHKNFSLTRSHRRQTIARDWSPARKRIVAIISCINTALIGVLIGIYAAEVPAIQYYIVDFHHYAILGNVLFFLGLAISTVFSWPLPLLHGRKPYTLGALSLAMPLLFPQALAVGEFRSPYVARWRIALLLPRGLMGFVLGFANMNFKSTLTDLFGASLQSANPHQEVVDKNDVRRHGGGMGVWLGIWTWCMMASNGIGFLIGAIIINSANPAWGFYISICIIAFVLLLNVVAPEVRRSAFRRSVAEVKEGEQVSRRLARGEVKMHMVQSGPKWWGEEFYHGARLSALMMRQPGFLIMALYVAWIYGQIILIIVLLGSLMSKYYRFKSPYVGVSITAVPIGALLSVPFQKAGLFSRDRSRTMSDDDTRDKKIGWSSHLVRRAIFVLVLPFAGLAYTLSSNGPPIPFILPIIFAGVIGFLSNLAMAECYGIIMETFDVSDLQPGMTGRPRRSHTDKHANKRTNYSSFPRVTAGFAITQSLGYLVAAAATGVGGVAQRHLGQKAATGVMAGILLVLSILLLGVLVRFHEVQIIPDLQKEAMERYMNARRESSARRGSRFEEDDLRPIIIGNPTHTTRRMCVLEMGSMSRWSEIRKKNHLIDQNSLEAKHPNIAIVRAIEDRIREKEKEITESIRHRLSREGSRRSKQSSESQQLESYRMTEPGPLGGHREMMSDHGIGRGEKSKRKRRKTTIHESVE